MSSPKCSLELEKASILATVDTVVEKRTHISATIHEAFCVAKGRSHKVSPCPFREDHKRRTEILKHWWEAVNSSVINGQEQVQ